MQRYIFYFRNTNILNIIFNDIVKFYTKFFGIMKLHWLKFGIVKINLYLCTIYEMVTGCKLLLFGQSGTGGCLKGFNVPQFLCPKTLEK